MAKLLKHEPTGRLFPFNPDLAKREDMVDYEPEVKEEKKPAPRKPAPKKPAPVKETTNDDLDVGDIE